MSTNTESAAPVVTAAERDRLRELGRVYGLRVLEQAPAGSLKAELIAELSVEWARAHALLPVELDGEICVLTADPDAVAPQEYLALLLGRDLRPVLAPRTSILRAIEQCYYSRDASPGAFLRDLGAASGVATHKLETSADLLEVATEAPVTQLANLILLEAVQRRASDIHFEPFQSRLRVRYRIDGILYEQTAPPKHMEEALVSRLKVMARMDIAEKRLPQDGMARVRVGEREIDIRLSTIPVAEGERVVLRLLDSQSALLPLSALGMLDTTRVAFEQSLTNPDGMLIVCGPTGSGKTTTLYAALGCLDASRRNILTIEDPIEYQLPNIGQMQVKPKIGLTFATGLRHMLRQDPDVILVGETRDLETAEIALRSALTGHLVFTTLHTNDAPGALLRLADMGVEPHLLAACLRGVLAQRLVRRLCPRCRQSRVLVPAAVPGLLAERLAPHAGREVWEAVGCAECLEGYKGRVGLYELMPIDAAFRDRIRQAATSHGDMRLAAIEHGMVTLLEDGLSKTFAGVTSIADVLAVV